MTSRELGVTRLPVEFNWDKMHARREVTSTSTPSITLDPEIFIVIVQPLSRPLFLQCGLYKKMLLMAAVPQLATGKKITVVAFFCHSGVSFLYYIHDLIDDITFSCTSSSTSNYSAQFLLCGIVAFPSLNHEAWRRLDHSREQLPPPPQATRWSTDNQRWLLSSSNLLAQDRQKSGQLSDVFPQWEVIG